jgi:hypothetical protein
MRNYFRISSGYQMNLLTKGLLLVRTALIDFFRDTLYSLGTILLEVQFGTQPYSIILKLTFLVVDTYSAYMLF